MRKVEILSQRRIFDDFFKIEEAELRFERFDGRMSPKVRRLNFQRGDSVSVLLFDPRKNHVLLVSQFKYPTYAKGPGWVTETVAGMIDVGETPENAARREVEEEMGYRVERLEHVATFYVSPGGTSERIVLYFAEIDAAAKSGAGGGLATEDEDIATIELPLDEALSQFRDGRIVDAKTIVALLWLQNRRAMARSRL
jgi:ADP-ribose pyrophosphatase